MPEGYVSRPALAPDHSLYLSLFWILSGRRGPASGSTPAHISLCEIGECYDRLAREVTDYDTFLGWIAMLDNEYCSYLTPKEDKAKGKEQLNKLNQENADLPIWT